MTRQFGAAELVVLLLFFGFLAAVGIGLYWIIRKAVAAGRDESAERQEPPREG